MFLLNDIEIFINLDHNIVGNKLAELLYHTPQSVGHRHCSINLMVLIK